MGEKSEANFLLRILITPCVVNNIPLRPLRVGITQSNISMPRSMPSNKFHGVPTPIKYLGLEAGKISQHISVKSYIISSGSPTLNPPIALPVAFFDAMYSQD